MDRDPRWAVEELDLEAYLDRVNIPASAVQQPDADTLARLHRHHIDTFPFENVDYVLGTAVNVSMRGLNTKLVHKRRGGHCVELNLLFAAALQRLGYRVERQAARVSTLGRESARSHAILHVTAGGTTWLADTAFSLGLLAPLPLKLGAQAEQGGKTYEVTQENDGEWILRVVSPESRELYRFRDEQLNWYDFDMISTWGKHNPGSPIGRGLFVARRTESTHFALRGTTLTATDHAGNRSVQEIEASQVPKLLCGEFGIQLTDSETSALVQKVLESDSAVRTKHNDSAGQETPREAVDVR